MLTCRVDWIPTTRLGSSSCESWSRARIATPINGLIKGRERRFICLVVEKRLKARTRWFVGKKLKVPICVLACGKEPDAFEAQQGAPGSLGTLVGSLVTAGRLTNDWRPTQNRTFSEQLQRTFACYFTFCLKELLRSDVDKNLGGQKAINPSLIRRK
jgi:hypothetical protein